MKWIPRRVIFLSSVEGLKRCRQLFVLAFRFDLPERPAWKCRIDLLTGFDIQCYLTFSMPRIQRRKHLSGGDDRSISAFCAGP